MNKLLSFYTSILNFAGISVDNEGYFYVGSDTNKIPVLNDGKRMVLPTDTHLKTSDPTKKIIFHPLTESPMRDESPVVSSLTKAINVKFSTNLICVFSSLLELAASPADHGKLTPDQTNLLIKLGEVDKTAISNFNSLFVNILKKDDKSSQENYKQIISMYLKKGGTISGKRYPRALIVSFPLLERMNEQFVKEKRVESIDTSFKLRQRDKEILKALYEFVLPNCTVVDYYSHGTDSSIAPFLHALYKGSEKTAAAINMVIDEYEQYIDEPNLLKFSNDWLDDFDNLDKFKSEIRMIPAQIGNDGDVIKTEPLGTKTLTALAAPTVSSVEKPQLITNTLAPVTPTAPNSPVTSNGKLDYTQFLRSQAMNQQQPMYGVRQAPINNTPLNYSLLPPSIQQPMYNQQPYGTNFLKALTPAVPNNQAYNNSFLPMSTL